MRYNVCTVLSATFLSISALTAINASAQTDIIVYDIDNNKLVNESAINISDRVGYDNQPFFTKDNQSVLYTQMSTVYGHEQTDIVRYDFNTGDTTNLTRTIQSSEYSPIETAIDNTISIIKVEPDGTQRLWYVDTQTGQQRILNRYIKPVGYHAWGPTNGATSTNKTPLAMFVLGDPMTLQTIDSPTARRALTIDSDIGRSIRYSAALNSFLYTVEMAAGDSLSRESQTTPPQQTLMRLRADDKQVSPLITLPSMTTSDNTQQHAQYYTLLNDTTVISATDGKLWSWKINSKMGWKPFADVSSSCSTSISRIAVNHDQTKLAVVCDE